VRTIWLLTLTLLASTAGLAIPPTFEARDPGHFLVRFGDGMADISPHRVTVGRIILRFAGADPLARMEGLGSPSPSTYLRDGFARTFQQYPRAAIHNLYRGVDAVFYGSGENLEYDLSISAGVSPERIRISVEGARGLQIDNSGKLIIDAGMQDLEQLPPRVFQGAREIPARYVLFTRNLVGIRLGKYDHRRSLTIDPVLAYARRFGAGNANLTQAIALDIRGNIYIAGQTNSTDYPTTPAALQPRLTPPLKVLSNAGETIRSLPVAGETNVGVVGGTEDGRILYASTADGIFLSGDSGETWRGTASLPVPSELRATPSILANAITVDSFDPATVLVATSAGLFGSTTGGEDWYPRHTGLPVSASGQVSVSSVFYDPANPLIAYAITNNPSYLFKTQDAGGTWLPLNPSYPGEPPAPTNPFMPIAAALTPDGKNLFAVNGNGTLLKSLDGGASWTPLAQSAFFSPAKIEFDRMNPNTMYVLDAVGLRRSVDGGASFSTIPTPLVPRQFAVDSAGALYVADGERMSVSADGGATFKVLSSLGFSINSLTLLAGDIYVGTTLTSVPFVTKLDPTGSNILYSTFLGGSAFDVVTALAVDAGGAVTLTGTTTSPDFPLTLPPAILPEPGRAAGFVAKLNPDGSRLVYSTLLGGSKATSVQAVALDSSGAAVLAGSTFSTDLPTTDGAFQPAVPPGTCPRTQSSFFIHPNTGIYGFVSKLSPDGGSLLYSTYLTGTCGSAVQSLALDSAGNAVVAGHTTSPDFPVSADSYQPAFPGRADQPSPPDTFNAGFVSKLSPGGDKLLASTYLGGGFTTQANALALDSTGNSYITGLTQGFPSGATPGAYQMTLIDRCVPPISIGPSLPYTGTTDAFVLKLDAGLSSASFLTYLGGACQDSGSSIGLDGAGNIWVSGITVSPDFPLRDPFQGGGISTGFLSQLSPDASTLLFSSLSDSQLLTLNDGGIYQAGTSGGVTIVSKVDPFTTPAVHIDSVSPVSGFAPTLVPSFIPGVAPGQLMEIKGRHLGPEDEVHAELDTVGRLPFVLGGAYVTFGNIPAPLLSVQAGSILCFAPFEINATTEISVFSNGQQSNVVRTGVAESVPRILSVVNQDGAVNSADHPAGLGSMITLYLSGLGETSPLSVDGLINTDPLPVPLTAASVFLPGIQLIPTYLGAAPGMIAGITQVNVPLPASIPDVNDTVSISVNGAGATLYLAR
jgi:uncharacterized protein (TIGR03437 family)